MQAEFINPFIVSFTTTFQTMLNQSVTRGKLALSDSLDGLYEVNGVIGLSGNAVGTIVLSFQEQVALKAASTLLLTEAVELDEDVTDAVGELTNMVAGAAKAKLDQYNLSISLPNVIVGHQIDVRFPSTVTPILVPFTCEWGEIRMQVGLAVKSCPINV
ncbi:MAG TPA: chemotaxis protein CheX [Planctomycetaceae bacterium]|nr:chemotaxis protein CheX [Planctomycetaceae bacterium]HRE99525.1 chemotaxis protein CheX [Pirellulaceae bacterium]